MNRTIAFFFIFLCLGELAVSQQLSRDDFNFGFLKLGSPIDSIVARLGQPETTRVNDIGHEYIGLDYPKLVIWYQVWDPEKWVCGFDIYSPSYVTRRGIKVGDSLVAITRLYGAPHYTTKEFDWLGPYDFAFHDYSQASMYRDGDDHLVFFTKNDLVVRILSYCRLEMDSQDWTIGDLTLGAPIDPILAHLGTPDTTVMREDGCKGYYYPKFVLWKDSQTDTLCAFDIYDSAYVTYRGLRIGDPLIKVERLYGHGDYPYTKTFDRVGPYDNTFTDYSQVYIVEQGYFFVTFMKNNKLVKMLYYIGVEE
jgi:hypothetical protein